MELFDPYDLLDPAVDWINEKLLNSEVKGILVHDFRGDWRAIMIILCYLIKYGGYNFPNASKYL